MQLVIVSEQEQIDVLKNEFNGNVAATAAGLKLMLKDAGVDAYTPKLRNYSDDAYIKWMKGLPKAAGKHGVDMLTTLSYDGLSYWWIMEKWLFRGDGHFDSISDTLTAVEVVDSLIKKFKPTTILFADDGRLYAKVIRHLAKAKNIPIRSISMNGSSFKARAADALIKRFWDVSFSIRKMYSKTADNGNNYDALFIRGIAWDRVYDYKTDKTQMIEPFTSNLIMKFPNSLSVGIQIGQFLNMRDARNLKGSDTILESYYDDVAKDMHDNIMTTIKKSYQELAEKEAFKNSFFFKGYDIWPLINAAFERYMDTRLNGHARTHAMVSRMIELTKPKVTVSPEEVSEFARILFHCSIKSGVPCVAIQHGIFDNNILCYHNKGEVTNTKTTPRLCPIPSRTCVYGKYYKNILIKKGNYPPTAVVVTGSQRFDRAVNQEFSKESFHKRIDVPMTKKIIAYITSPTAYNEEMTKALLEEANKIPNAMIVIKIHPAETRGFYEKIITTTKSDAIVLDDADLYDVLNASDVMVTYLSTAGLEAMLMNKPVAILNLTGADDIVSYVKSGAAAGMYKKENIVPVLTELLDKGKLYKKIMANSVKFIDNNAYNRDGKATERITDVIRNLMK